MAIGSLKQKSEGQRDRGHDDLQQRAILSLAYKLFRTGWLNDQCPARDQHEYDDCSRSRRELRTLKVKEKVRHENNVQSDERVTTDISVP